MFCIYLRTNCDLCHLQHKPIGFYNRDEKCLQRGTDWVFKYSGLRFVCKGLISLHERVVGYACTKITEQSYIGAEIGVSSHGSVNVCSR